MSIVIALVLLTLLSLLMVPAHAWDDPTSTDRNALVFQGRHQAYGAFRLRRRYGHHVAFGLLGAFGFMALLAVGARLLAPGSLPPLPPKPPEIDHKLTGIIFNVPDAPAPKQRQDAPAPVERKAADPDVPRLVDASDDEIPPAPPIVDSTLFGGGSDRDDAGAGGGTGPVGLEGPSGGGGGPGIIDDGEPFEPFLVDELPAFPGGEAALAEWVNRNLDYYPDRPGREELYVMFTILQDGSVSDVRTIKGGSKAFRAAAERTVLRMPRWAPARVNGMEVRCRLTLPIRMVTR